MRHFGSIVLALAGFLAIACGPTVEVDDSGTGGAGTGDTTTDADSSGEPGEVDSSSSESTTSQPGTDEVTGDIDGGQVWSEGPHLWVMSIALQPNTPLQAIATVTFPSPDVLALELQWLTLDAGSTTEPREATGEPMQWTTDIGPDGSFELALGQLVVPGRANPITGGDITVVPTLTGSFLASGGACGEISGQIVAPLTADISGSTFAGLVLDDPEVLPLPEPSGC